MRIFAVLFFIVLLNIANAQPCACCSEERLQFDFWVGEWIVTDTLGNKLGENTIAKKENGCLLTEYWRGSKGTTGRSMNYFDKADSTWNQLWIDNNGGNLKLKGKLIEDKMILKSAPIKRTNNAWIYNQISWIPKGDGTVIQLWEVYSKMAN